MAETILTRIKADKSRIFRRAYVKRRLATTGLFEANWQEITVDVKKWGAIRRAIDAVRTNKIRFGDMLLQLANDRGLYNPSTEEASLWFGYANQQRTMVKVEAGFVHQTLGSNGIWTNTEYPNSVTAFLGILSGDMMVSDNNQVTIPVKPLLQVFRDFAAANLTGWTSAGMTMNQFMTMVRDQTDGAGSYVFRPFFGDTTTGWNYTSSATIYTTLNTAGGDDIRDASVWDVIEKLAEAENLCPYVTRDGIMTVKDRTQNTATAAFQFFGRGIPNSDYGHTIKKVGAYGKRLSNYYSRVNLKWGVQETITSYSAVDATLTVNGTNNPWNLGARAYDMENLWVNTTTAAATLANSVWQEVSSLKTEIEFSTSFIPQLDVLDRVEVTYDSAAVLTKNLWDVQDWADAATTTADLYWDNSKGDSIQLVAAPFKLLSVELDLDKLETRFIGRTP